MDLLLANRPLTLAMLSNSSDTDIEGVRVVSPEGIIGLKIQAYSNDSTRRLRDLADIESLINLENVDLKKVKEYADLFDEWSTVEDLVCEK